MSDSMQRKPHSTAIGKPSPSSGWHSQDRGELRRGLSGSESHAGGVGERAGVRCDQKARPRIRVAPSALFSAAHWPRRIRTWSENLQSSQLPSHTSVLLDSSQVHLETGSLDHRQRTICICFVVCERPLCQCANRNAVRFSRRSTDRQANHR